MAGGLSYQPVYPSDDSGDDDEKDAWNKPNGNGVFHALTMPEKGGPLRSSTTQPKIFRICAVVACMLAALVFGVFLYGDLTKHSLPPRNVGLVLASYWRQDISWMRDVPDNFKIYRYVLDDPTAVYRVPRNQGREAMAYLTYIIDNYHDLPEYTFFIHGHDRGWHQLEHMSWKIRALNLTELKRTGYINFRCNRLPGCTADTSINVKYPMQGLDERPQAMLLPNFWDEQLKSIPRPERLEVPCCGQFAVTREAIRKHPLWWWKKFRKPLETDVEKLWDQWDVPEPREENLDSYRIGVLYEKTWHVVFGQDPVYCPEEEYCQKVQFSDKIACDSNIGFFQDSKGWQQIQCHSPWGSDNFTELVDS